MANDDTTGQDRTEAATTRRRQQARDQGRVARSPDLATAAVLVAAALALGGFAGSALVDFATRTLHESLRGLAAGALHADGAAGWLQQLTLGFLLSLLPLGVAGIVVGATVNVVQTGGVVSSQAIMPKLAHVSPLAGWKRIVGLDGVMNLVKSLLRVIVLVWVAVMVVTGAWPEISALAGAGAGDAAHVLRALLLRLSVTVGGAFVLVAAFDYVVQRVRHERSLRMTKQEVVREHRETEGDPLVKARMLSIAKARARQRMLQAVPRADVVVVNPVHIAVALRYDTDVAPAPIVVAMGERKLAERIRDIAAKHGVPIVENKPVARALKATAKVGDMIPAALYAAIAEILAFVYRQRHGAAAPGRPA